MINRHFDQLNLVPPLDPPFAAWGCAPASRIQGPCFSHRAARSTCGVAWQREISVKHSAWLELVDGWWMAGGGWLIVGQASSGGGWWMVMAGG